MTIIAGVSVIIGWMCLFIDKLGISFICFSLTLSICIYSIICDPFCNVKETPTALDVYRGKTTLEITYRDSVAVDSIVVYKVK